MATVKVCDVCGKSGRVPFTITEKDGRVYDACTAACLIAGGKDPEVGK
jgi:hypothetical protein